VQPGYAPAGKTLLSVSLLGEPAEKDSELLESISDEVRSWWPGRAVTLHPLRVVRVPYALPDRVIRRRLEDDWVTLAGDYTRDPSINGALRSGRKAALANLA